MSTAKISLWKVDQALTPIPYNSDTFLIFPNFLRNTAGRETTRE